MTVKSVLEIEVEDSEFQAYVAKFQSYQAAMKELPEAWGALDKGVSSTATSFQDMTAALLAQRALFREQDKLQSDAQRNAAEAAKAEREAIKAKKKALDDQLAQMRKQREQTKQIATDMKDAAGAIMSGGVGIAKWLGLGGIASGLLGLGGFFGLDRLANDVSDQRRSALGLGISTGEQSAVNLDFGQVIDSRGALQGLATAKQDITKAWAFSSLGIKDYRTKNPAQLLGETMEQIDKIYQSVKNSPAAEQIMKARGIDALGISMDSVRAWGNLPSKEKAERLKSARDDAILFKRQDEVSQKWGDFSRTLARSGIEIQNVLVNGLQNLTEPLGHVSAAFTKVVDALVKSPVIAKWLDQASQALEGFAQYIGTPKFETDVSNFVENVGKLADSVVKALKFMGLIPDGPTGPPGSIQNVDNPKPSGPMTPEQKQRQIAWFFNPFAGFNTNSQPVYQDARAEAIAEYYKAHGANPAIAAGLAANIQAESGGNPNASVIDTDLKRHRGLLSWSPERWAAFQKWAALNDKGKSDREKQLDFAYAELMKTTGAKLQGITDPRAAGAIIAHNDVRPWDPFGAVARHRGDMAAGIAKGAGGGGAPDMDALKREFHNDMQKVAAALKWSPAAVEKDVQQHGADWLRFAPKDAQAAAKAAAPANVHVTIHNPAGAQVSVQANQLVPQ